MAVVPASHKLSMFVKLCWKDSNSHQHSSSSRTLSKRFGNSDTEDLQSVTVGSFTVGCPQCCPISASYCIFLHFSSGAANPFDPFGFAALSVLFGLEAGEYTKRQKPCANFQGPLATVNLGQLESTDRVNFEPSTTNISKYLKGFAKRQSRSCQNQGAGEVNVQKLQRLETGLWDARFRCNLGQGWQESRCGTWWDLALQSLSLSFSFKVRHTDPP